MFERLKFAPATLAAFGLLAGAAAAEGLKAAADVKIAVVVHGASSDAYWSVVKRGVDDAAAATGAQVQYIAPQVFDSVEQARLIEAAVATKPDGIVISLPDKDALAGAVRSALDAGIPVINIDSGEVAGEELGVPMYVGTTSEYQAGIRAGERLAAAGILTVACINHEVGNISLDERCQGINDGLAPAGGAAEVVAVSQDPADVTRRVEAYLAAHPQTQAVFATGTAGANPLIKYFDEQDLWSKYKLYTYDLGPEILQSVADGKMGFGIDGQQYLMGYLPVIYLVQYATHGLWVQNDTYTGPLFIDTPEKAAAVQQLSKEGTR
ncbi:MAG: sugar ABC transporter substrate-binding protein [Rhodobacteraceae bacterium]|nr:sugar ABC transporter substrate-binding protein [Paracoccaceae bacterium]